MNISAPALRSYTDHRSEMTHIFLLPFEVWLSQVLQGPRGHWAQLESKENQDSRGPLSSDPLDRLGSQDVQELKEIQETQEYQVRAQNLHPAIVK